MDERVIGVLVYPGHFRVSEVVVCLREGLFPTLLLLADFPTSSVRRRQKGFPQVYRIHMNLTSELVYPRTLGFYYAADARERLFYSSTS